MLRDRELERLAGDLADAWQKASVIIELPDERRPQNRAEAYAVQDTMARLLGEPVSGWKLGATSQRMRELDGHDDVIPGRMFASTTFTGTDLELPAERFPDARVETEFAFRLTRDIELREKSWTAAEVAPRLLFHPALEIIGNRYPTGPRAPHVGSLETIADNGGGIGFVFGDGVADIRGVDFRNHVIALRVDDRTAAENFLGDMRCLPFEAVADLANHLRERGEALKSGDFVSTGAATVPQHVTQGSRVHADFGVLGSIRVHFT
ncbi:MAG: hydratase [Gammaproteobacteria bacterium]|nr:hydratase [Gammaproteobacteria bacterium]